MNESRSPAPWARGRVLVLLSCLSALFAALGAAVTADATLPLDVAIRETIHGWASPALTTAAIAASIIGGTYVIVASLTAITAYHWFAGDRRAATRLSAVMAAALVIDLATKYGYRRIRPDPYFGAAPESYSFPSGHSLFAVAFFGTLLVVRRRRIRRPGANAVAWLGVLLLVAAIGLSRIYLGVHYPSDVAGGYLAGLFTVVAVNAALEHPRLARPS